MVTISHQTNGKTNGTTKHNAFADIGGWPFIQDDRISWYQKNILSLTPYHCGYYTVSLINFLHLLQSIASSLCSCRIWQFFFYNLTPSFLWPTSGYYSFHFINPCIFWPNYSCPILKHAHTHHWWVALYLGRPHQLVPQKYSLNHSLSLWVLYNIFN